MMICPQEDIMGVNSFMAEQSVHWFLHDRDLRHERVKIHLWRGFMYRQTFSTSIFFLSKQIVHEKL